MHPLGHLVYVALTGGRQFERAVDEQHQLTTALSLARHDLALVYLVVVEARAAHHPFQFITTHAREERNAKQFIV